MADQFYRIKGTLAERFGIERHRRDSDAEACARRFAAGPEGRGVVHDASARSAAEPPLERRNSTALGKAT